MKKQLKDKQIWKYQNREPGWYWVSRCTQETVREIGWYNGKKWQLMNSSGLWYEKDIRNINEKRITEDEPVQESRSR